MKIKTILPVLICVSCLSGCATGSQSFTPSKPVVVIKSKVINLPVEQVWAKSIPKLGNRFYVINTLDKSSGLISLSFSGNPEQFVDCGRMLSVVKNARGERTYDINLAKKSNFFEVLENGNLWQVDRKLTFEGRINLIFESIMKDQTKVTANVRYSLTRTARSVGGMRTDGSYQPFDSFNSDTISFDSAGEGAFSISKTICRPNGNVEKEILELTSK